MKQVLLGGLSTLLLPFTAHAATTSAGGYLMRGGYQPRSYMRVNADPSYALPTTALHVRATLPRQQAGAIQADTLDIQQRTAITELVIVDGSVPDKSTLYRGLRAGVAMVEIDAGQAGLPQLVEALRDYRDLSAIHIVSHAEAGVLQLGSSRVTAEDVHRELGALSALRDSVRQGGDLLFYGCDLAANAAGEALLDILRNETGLDVAASDNLTGNGELGGDWTLEIQRGEIEAGLAFSAKALADFSGVLAASNGTHGFAGWSGAGTTQLSTTDFRLAASSGGVGQNMGNGLAGNFAYMHNGDGLANNYFYLRADGTNTTSFELTGLSGKEAPESDYVAQFSNVRIVGYLQTGGTVTSSALSGTGGKDSFAFGAGQLAAFAGVKLKGFKLFFDCASACDTTIDGPEFFELHNFTIVNAVNTPPPPVVTDARVSISGASGTSGAYKIGDTVTATWNNTAGGDNNGVISGVTVDFSQFGGGAAVAATNSSNTWTASYTITAGTIDTTARNVSVTATNAGGSDTTADTTNATIDNVAPTVTDARIGISGATGTGGAYKIGDTVTATWNNTAGGDNNSDTISSATVNFSQFGGGATVAATNSSGTWTATYTISAGAIAASNLNIAFTANDDAGNATTTADTSNAMVDSIAPSVTSIAVSGSPAATDAAMAFSVNFNGSVSNVSTDDFTLVSTGSATGSIASVSAASGSVINVNINDISGNGTLKVNLNGSTNIADDAGNTVAAYTSGSTHTVAVPTAPGAPTIGTATAGDGQASVTFTAPGSNGGSAITTYTATASPGGAFGTCAGPAACTATVTGLSNGTAYSFTVTATNATGTSVASGASNSATPKGNQTITFANPGAQNFGTAPTLAATATSTLAVAFTSSTTGVCTITSGGVLTFVTAGTCTIDADQAGNTTWSAATTVTRSFTVNAVVPAAPTIGNATAGDTQATVTFTAPASTGGAAIIASGYTVTANPGGATATGSSSPITVTGLTNGLSYTFTVTATNSAGEGSASDASNSITPASPQTITFNNPGTQNFGTTPTLTATSSAGGAYPVSFTSATSGVCTISTGGALTFVTAGSCTINANQAGDSSYLAASQVSQTFTVSAVAPGAPTAATATAGDTQASISFTTPVFIGGAAITGYTVTVSPADVAPINGAASPIVVTGLTNGQAYTFTVTATNSSGTGPASAASNSITPAASQTITFATPGAQDFGTTPTFTATADSGLTPTFTSSTAGVCTITTGGALTFVTAGTCTINADQAGNSSYLPAPQVIRSFAVNAVVPGAPAIGTASVTGPGAASVSFTAPGFDGGASVTSYTVTSSPGGFTGTGTASPIAVTGLADGVAYTFTVTATNPAGTSTASAASNSITPAGNQILTFTNPGAQDFGTTPTLTATADSGLIPVFTSNTPGVCAITNSGALTFITTGTCTIQADQAGDGIYLPAASVSHSFAVNAVVASAPTIGTASATGPGAASVSFTAPGFDGGASVTSYTVTSSPSGFTGTGTASPVAVTGLGDGVAYTFTVTATNPAGTGAASAPSNSITSIPSLLTSPVSATVPYAAAATPITLAIIGSPTSVTVDSAPAHGTATASGTTITYQPNPGYAGPDSFTYTATDAYTTSAAAAVNITVEAATIVLDNTALAPATGGTSYQRQFSASGGTAPYTFQLLSGSLPAGLSLSTNGELSGTPTVAGSFDLTVRATDSSTGTGPFQDEHVFTLAVNAPELLFALDVLPAAIHGGSYDQSLDVSGGTAPYTFAVTTGSMPAGIALSADGGLSGVPEQAGQSAFTVEVRDANGFTASQDFELLVEQAAQAIIDFSANPEAPVYVPNGSFDLSATGGASGNAVVFATTTPATCKVIASTVTMLSAGLCTLTADQAGDANYSAAVQVVLQVTIASAVPVLLWVEELQKIYGEAAFDLPEPQSNSDGSFTYSSDNPQVATVSGRQVTLIGAGTATLTATQAASGNYTTGTVQMRLVVTDRPDPTRDPDVVGGLQAQVDASVRFATAQQGNIRSRLRQIRNGDNGSNMSLALAYAGDGTIPGMSLPVGQAIGGRWPMLTNGWGAWMAGTVNFGKSGNAQRYEFQSDGVTLGADRALGERALIGVAGSMARHDSDAVGSASRVQADQRSLAVYGLWGTGEHLFVDGLLAYGQLDFDLLRWSALAGRAANAQREGDQLFGSLTFGYEHRNAKGLSLTGYGRFDGSRTNLDPYQESGLGLYDLDYRGQTVQNTSLALGMEGSHEFGGTRARYRPFWSLEYTQALENQGMARMNYVQQPVSSDYGLRLRSYYDHLFAIGAGMDIRLDTGWLFTMQVGHEQGRNSTRASSVGLSISYGAGGGRSAVQADNGLAGQQPEQERKCQGRRCR